MTSKFGNPDILKNKYGELNVVSKPKNIKKSQPINPKAIFNKESLKITLPSEPSLTTHIIIFEEENKIISNVTDYQKYHILNFIDTSKLIEGRPGFKSKSYFLEELKYLAKILKIYKNEKPKSYFIEAIKKEINDEFGEEPNLIADIKKLTLDDVKKIKNIEQLFIKHNIAEPTKTTVINNIKNTIKKYYTSDTLVNQIINSIENEWKK